MTKKQLAKLVEVSFTQNNLDAKKTDEIAQLLKRKDLKSYIKSLKSFESKKTVIISLANEPSENVKEAFAEVFPEKQIMYVTDPALLMGVKIVNFDMEYDLNLKHMLENLLEYIANTA